MNLVDVAIAFAGGLLLLKLFSKAARWKHRLGAITSPLLQSPAYRVLFLLVVVGLVLICTLPEAAFVLPALDAIGLDLVTIFVALELRHYVTFVARRLRVPAHPLLWAYQGMGMVVWIKTLNGTLWVSVPRQA